VTTRSALARDVTREWLAVSRVRAYAHPRDHDMQQLQDARWPGHHLRDENRLGLALDTRHGPTSGTDFTCTGDDLPGSLAFQRRPR
jgi:hypothetical protein